MKVIEMTTNAFWKGELGVKGLVEDSDKQYNVSLYVKGSQIHDYSCSCAQGNSYQGMCVHAKLVKEAFEEQRKSNSQKLVSTSQEVRTMIREYTNREVADIVEKGEDALVGFIPRLIISRRDMTLEFKLGRDKYYVIKDMAAFARNVEVGAYVEYGKNLAFHHSLNVFTQESRPLVEFVIELVNAYLENHTLFHKQSFSTIPILRELNLSKTNRDRFFGLMMEQSFEVEDRRGLKHMLSVCDDNPQLQIMVRKAGRNGIKISMSKSWACFTGEKYLYLADKEHIYRCSQDFKKTMEVFLEQMMQVPGNAWEVSVHDQDIPLFYERVLRKFEPYGILDVKNVDFENYRPEELKAEFYFDSNGTDEITLEPKLSYGSYSFHPVEDERVPRTVCRDVPGEFKISRLITKYFKYRENDSKNLIIRENEDEIYQLLTEGMGEFLSMGQVYLSEEFKKLKIIQSPKVTLGVSMTDGWLKLDINSGEMSGAELNRILSEYTQKKRYFRMKNGEFLNLDDDGMLTLADLVERMGISKTDLQNKQITLPKYRALYLDGLFKEGTGITLYRDQLFKAVVRGMKSVEDSDFEIPDTMKPVLRLYQKHGYRWLRTLDAYGFGGILADDMGLGKTVQVLSVLLDEKLHGIKQPTLIICPASLVYNWENEIKKFTPSLSVATVVGTAQERELLIKQAQEYDVLVTSYDLLKRDILWYEEIRFRFQVIDEAQYIKNPSTQSAKAVKSISARTKFALTGTPIENRLSELWSIFDYLMPGFLFSYQRFKKEYELPIVKEQDGRALKNLHRLIGPFVLRRMKEDVLKELPQKLEQVVYSRMEGEQKQIYTAHALRLKQQLEEESDSQYDSGKLQILAELTRLRQLCCDPVLCVENYKSGSAKLETCIELVQNAIEGGHKILLFSQFTSMLEIIGKRLTKEGIAYYTLTGATSKEERGKTVNAFQKDQIPVFLISLKAGGTGLNLTAADVVIHYDPWWNVAAQNQATDRTHRIGQENQVAVFKLITKGTVEENILKLQEAKQNLASQIITEGTVSLGSLTKEALIDILN